MLRRTPIALFGILALALLAIAPVSGGGVTLQSPDRRAILMLVSQNKNTQKFGTGVVIGPSTILTAGHAVADRMEVRLPKTVVSGRAVCRTRDDLAIIRAALPKGTPFYRLASRTPKVGETIRVAGYPDRKWVVVRGRVTHVVRSATLGGRKVNAPMIVFWPALRQGASGAPLFDARGQVIAIFVASNSRENYSIAFPSSTGLRTCRRFVT